MKAKLILSALFLLLSTCIFSQNVWAQKPTFAGTPRADAGGFAIGGKGYIGSGTNSTDFWEYDTTNGVWTAKANLPHARSGAVFFSIGSKGYFGTGFYNNTNNDYNDFYEYNPATNQWTQKASFPGSTRYEAFGFSMDINGDGTTDRGYIGGGASWNGSTNDMYEYNPNANTWTLVANAVGATSFDYGVAFAIGTKAYIGRGNLNTFWEWDQPTGAWTAKASYPGNGNFYLFGFAIGNKGYMGGGSSAVEEQDFWEYDTALNQWTQQANFGGGDRAEAVGFTIGNKGYVGTGFVGNVLKQDFWQYPATITAAPGNIAQADNLLVYPNPCRSFITIEIPRNLQLENLELRLFDAEGVMQQEISSVTKEKIRVETGDLPGGLYFLQLISNDRCIATKKIAVQ